MMMMMLIAHDEYGNDCDDVCELASRSHAFPGGNIVGWILTMNLVMNLTTLMRMMTMMLMMMMTMTKGSFIAELAPT